MFRGKTVINSDTAAANRFRESVGILQRSARRAKYVTAAMEMQNGRAAGRARLARTNPQRRYTTKLKLLNLNLLGQRETCRRN
jgi:hypothetical protein